MIAAPLKCTVSAFLIPRILTFIARYAFRKGIEAGLSIMRQGGRMYIPVEYPMEYKCMSNISGTISYHKVSAIELWKSTVRKLKNT